jgi:cell wall assembly regulator SMI1
MKFTSDKKPLISSKQIEDLEMKIKMTLPIDYKEFLLEHNGGIPERQLLYIPDCAGETLVDNFLGIDRINGDIFKWIRELNDDLKGIFVPIAFDPGGNALLLDPSDSAIYYWDSARHFPVSTDEENAYLVASSFTNLLEILKP